MRDPTRYGLSGVLSLVAHAIFVLAFLWAAHRPEQGEERPEEDEELAFEIDFIEFEVDDEDPDLAQGEPEPDPPEEEPPAPEESAPPPVEQPLEPEAEAPAPPEPEPEAPPKPRFGDKKSKIAAMVPPKSTWTLMLANKRIKKLPFRESATELMAPLRDFRLLVDDAGFNVWEDFDFIVMGSPNALDQTKAFVAVQYANFGHDEMKAGIERATARWGMTVDWREENEALIGDPRFIDEEIEEKNPDDRQFVLLPGDKVAVYAREMHVPQIVSGPDSSKGKTQSNFVANVAKMRRYTNAEPKAGVQVVFEDIRSMIRVKGLPFEIPSRLELMWEAARSPELVIKLDFLAREHAEKAVEYWNEHLESDLRKLGGWDVAGGIISGTTIERDERTVILRHEFNEVAARVVLQLVASEFAKQMRYSKKEAEEAAARRAENWERREGGKLLPSEVLDRLEEEGVEVPEGAELPEGVEVPEGAELPEGAEPHTKPEAPAPEPEAPAPEPEAPAPKAPTPQAA